jgi:hypothetical protein
MGIMVSLSATRRRSLPETANTLFTVIVLEAFDSSKIMSNVLKAGVDLIPISNSLIAKSALFVFKVLC